MRINSDAPGGVKGRVRPIGFAVLTRRPALNLSWTIDQMGDENSIDPLHDGVCIKLRNSRIERHFLLILEGEGVYDLGRDSLLAWSRHLYRYPLAAGALSAAWARLLPGLWFRAICEFLLIWYFDSRNRAGRLWT